MKRLIITFVFSLVVPLAAAAMPATGTVDVYYSPDGGAAKAIVGEISAAKKEILVQAYSFTNAAIAGALR